jgi:hypothetical protein
VVTCGLDIGGRVSDGAYCSFVAGERSGALNCEIVDVYAVFKIVTEGAEVEIAEQIAGLKLDGADCLQVSCGNTEECVTAAEMLQNVNDPREGRGANLMPILANVGAHRVAGSREPRAPSCFGDTCKCQSIAEDAGVSVAVSGDAIKVEFAAGERLQSLAKGEVVHGISAGEQRAIDIEKICIERVPGAREGGGALGYAIFCE